MKRKDMYLNLIKVILGQPIDNTHHLSIVDNFLTILWIISSLSLTLIYSNCIYSLMVIPSKAKTIDTIKQLYESIVNKELSVYTAAGGNHANMLKVCYCFN